MRSMLLGQGFRRSQTSSGLTRPAASQAGQAWGGRITGMRSWITATASFARQVTMAKCGPSPASCQMAATAICAPSASEIT